MKNRLVCFDFDDTLFHTPRPEIGKKIWEEKTGEMWPYNGWWGKSETIDPDMFHIPMNEWVKQRYVEHKEEGSNIIVATGRLKKVSGMMDNILRIFEDNSLEFSEVHLNWGGDTLKFKQKLFEEKMDEHGPDEFIMYDDRHEHLGPFRDWARNQADHRGISITVVDVVNKKFDTFSGKQPVKTR